VYLPDCSIQLFSSCPDCRKIGGVPVKIRSPGNRGQTADSRAIRSGTGKIMPLVRARCRHVAGLTIGQDISDRAVLH